MKRMFEPHKLISMRFKIPSCFLEIYTNSNENQKYWSKILHPWAKLRLGFEFWENCQVLNRKILLKIEIYLCLLSLKKIYDFIVFENTISARKTSVSDIPLRGPAILLFISVISLDLTTPRPQSFGKFDLNP